MAMMIDKTFEIHDVTFGAFQRTYDMWDKAYLYTRRRRACEKALLDMDITRMCVDFRQVSRESWRMKRFYLFK